MCLVALLMSCGFRLRGGVELPAELKSVHITGVAEFSDLYQELKRVLLRSGAKVTLKPEQALSVITISGEQMRKRVLSVDSQGRAAEYGLNYRFSFSVHTNQSGSRQESVSDKSINENTILIPSQQISLARDFRFDPDNVLATDAQEKQKRLELVKFSVQQVLRRIQSILKSSAPTETKSQT